MKSSKIKSFAVFLALTSSIHTCNAAGRGIDGLPKLIKVITTDARSKDKNYLKNHMESCSAETLFEQTREFAKYTRSLSSYVSKEDAQAAEKKYSQVLRFCYEKVFTKAGGRASLNAIQDESLGTLDVPLIVRAAHNYAINLSKDDDTYPFQMIFRKKCLIFR